jgi:hypothetical protein
MKNNILFKCLIVNKSSIRKIVTLFLLIMMPLLFLNCGSSADSGADLINTGTGVNQVEEFSLAGDKIKFISVSPKSNLVDATEYDFEVVISYELHSIEAARIDIGYNTDNIMIYTLVAGAEETVTGENGEHTFSGKITVRDWGNTGELKAYVQLSEDTEDAPAIPLAYSTMVLLFEE